MSNSCCMSCFWRHEALCWPRQSSFCSVHLLLKTKVKDVEAKKKSRIKKKERSISIVAFVFAGKTSTGFSILYWISDMTFSWVVRVEENEKKKKNRDRWTWIWFVPLGRPCDVQVIELLNLYFVQLAECICDFGCSVKQQVLTSIQPFPAPFSFDSALFFGCQGSVCRTEGYRELELWEIWT